MSHALLAFGILLIGLGIWSGRRGSRSWGMRIFVGAVFVLAAGYLYLTP